MTVVLLETAKATLTVVLVLVGLGDGAATVTVGGEAGFWAGLHAVKGWSSHPDQLCVEKFSESASQ